MAKAETWTWRDLITPVSVLTIGAIAVAVFACELRGIEARLTDMDSKIANLDAKIDGRGEAVEQHLTQTDNLLAETTKRLDLGLDQQADMSSTKSMPTSPSFTNALTCSTSQKPGVPIPLIKNSVCAPTAPVSWT
jgi:hypothetical protein